MSNAFAQRMLALDGLQIAPTTDAEEARAAIRPSGQQLFDRLTPEQQDAAVGAAAAEKLRAGEIELSDLVDHVPAGDAPGFLVQKPLQDL